MLRGLAGFLPCRQCIYGQKNEFTGRNLGGSVLPSLTDEANRAEADLFGGEKAMQKLEDRVEPMLRRRELCALVGMSTTTIYRMMREGRFPRPVQIGDLLVAWRERDVAEWQRSRTFSVGGHRIGGNKNGGVRRSKSSGPGAFAQASK